MKNTITTFLNTYGFFVLAGFIGALINRLRNKMTLWRFFGALGVSAFIGFCVGVLMNYFFEFPAEVVFVACALSGVFSNKIFNEISEIIAFASDYVKKLLNLNKTNQK